MDADLYSEETADREAPSAHRSIVFARGFRNDKQNKADRRACRHKIERCGLSPGLFVHAN